MPITQATELNTILRAKLGVSSIHGVGVIALRDIKAGEQLHLEDFPKVYDLRYEDFDKLLSEVRELILEHFARVVNNSRFAMPDTRLLAYMNHSLKPNYDSKSDTAIYDISKGGEVLEDYTEMPNWEKVFPPDKCPWIYAHGSLK